MERTATFIFHFSGKDESLMVEIPVPLGFSPENALTYARDTYYRDDRWHVPVPGNARQMYFFRDAAVAYLEVRVLTAEETAAAAWQEAVTEPREEAVAGIEVEEDDQTARNLGVASVDADESAYRK